MAEPGKANGIAQLLGVTAGIIAILLVGSNMSNSLEREIKYERETMNLLVSAQKGRIARLDEMLHSHMDGDVDNWRRVNEANSETNQRFVEVETQFDDLERRIRDRPLGPDPDAPRRRYCQRSG